MKRHLFARGFTLVELLVAVALLSLIMVAFYTIFEGGIKAYETGEKRVELIQNARAALSIMTSQIRQALPEDASANPPLVLEIGADRIRFSTPIGGGMPGIKEITFYLSSGTIYRQRTLPHRWYDYYKVYKPPYTNPPFPEPVTAALPGTEGIVSYLLFEEKELVGTSRSGLIRITLTVKADPADQKDPGITLHAIVKCASRYGEGLSGKWSW